ncbi:hypothetical protein BDN70DRAFT_892479 [Pholiota conissans]|uniref:Uncharacterized protein n=1 Tax=Pholiota conissans TaxID=109636 RepID=A0A9P5Z842_9AGAR|nr:hypothetical protein BDN70DRAFT_892479 [Pholiota conissans]
MLALGGGGLPLLDKTYGNVPFVTNIRQQTAQEGEFPGRWWGKDVLSKVERAGLGHHLSVAGCHVKFLFINVPCFEFQETCLGLSIDLHALLYGLEEAALEADVGKVFKRGFVRPMMNKNVIPPPIPGCQSSQWSAAHSRANGIPAFMPNTSR